MRIILTLAAAAFALLSSVSAGVRLKDVVDVEGVRANDLVGYGLVVGLDGSGDSIRSSPYTEEAVSNLLERLGVNIQGEDFRSRNVAAVIVTAALPAFARAGSQIDVTVSAIGDADNLLGGTLIMTPLKAADGATYAVAQGPVLASGISAEGEAASVTFGAPTTGSIPQGARVEREVAFRFGETASLRLALRAPDFTTAMRVEEAINAAAGRPIARVLDPGTIDVDHAASGMDPVRLMSAIENLEVETERKARIVIDQKSGTVVMGAEVKLSAFAVTQGGLTITVAERPVASQPNAFAGGDTVVLPDTTVAIDPGAPRKVALVSETATLADLVAGLNALGVGPRDLIDILKSVKAAGALHAELVIM